MVTFVAMDTDSATCCYADIAMPTGYPAMKLRLALVLLALAPFPTHAQTKKPTPEQLCGLAGSWAAVVMQARQNGHPLSSVLQGFGKAPGGSREHVLAAYEQPRYSTAEMQQKAVQDFQNTVELDCFKKLR